MPVLDPKITGEVLCGRLLFGNRGVIECRTTSLVIAIPIFEMAEYHFYSALARAGAFDSASRGLARAALQSSDRSSPAACNMGRKLPGEFRKPCRTGRRGNRPDRRPRPRCHAPLRAGHSLGPRPRFRSERSALPMRWPPGSTTRAASRHPPTPICARRGIVISAGAPTARYGSSIGFTRIWPVREGQHPAAIIGSPVQHLDVASVVKASQALSSEIVLPKLIERLMKIAIENAGADRGLLILPSGDEYLIQAEARATGDQIEVTMRQEPITGITCPESLVRYVIRTLESVILDDASKPNLFSGDDYLRDRQSKSILCLPLMKQRELTGILLLENALISHAFTPARIAVLELLAGTSSDLARKHPSLWRSCASGRAPKAVGDLSRRREARRWR